MNYLAILLAAVVGMVVGFLWYGPLFGKTWIKLSGFTHEDMEKAQKKGMNKTYALAFVALLVTSWIIRLLMYQFGLDTSTTLRLAFLIWLGFLVPTMANSVLWEGKSFKLYCFNIAERLVTLLLMSGVLSFWK